MKTIEQLTNELGIEAIKIHDSSDKNSKYHMEYLCQSELLELLCEAYMADRLGELEAVACLFEDGLGLTQYGYHNPNFVVGTKLYDLSELKAQNEP